MPSPLSRAPLAVVPSQPSTHALIDLLETLVTHLVAFRTRRRPAVSARAAAALVATTLLAAACTTGSAGSSGGGSPKAGGTLTFAVGSDAGCVDPQQVGSNDTIYSLRQVVDSLTDQDPKTGAIVPWLAQRWEVSPDARTFTFHLRPGATFSDGTPVNAAAVKADFDAVPKLGPLATLAKGYLAGTTGTTVVDDLTVQVAFGQPNAQFLQATSTFSLGIVSPATAALTPQARCSQGVVGSGPFVLDKYVQNQSITLDKRRGYAWGSSCWSKPGEAYLDRLVFKVLPEAGVRTGSLQSGQVDAIGSVGQADEAALKGSGAQLLSRANPGVVFNLSFNNARPVLQDAAVRQAVQLAVDRNQIASAVFPTGTRPATSVLARTTPDYTDLGGALGTDIARANALLDGSGWVRGGDGIRTKNGARLSLVVVWFPVAATNQPALELIQQQLRVVGIDVQLKQLPVSSISSSLQAGDFDAAWGNVTRADPDILRAQFSAKGVNFYRLPTGPLDDALTAQSAATDPTKRQQLVTQAQQLLVQNAYAIPVVELQTELGVAKDVHDLAFEASSRIQLHDTWKG